MTVRTHVDLFSGIGGFALACRWANVETVAFAEIDPYASKVLDKNFPGVRNYGRVQDVPAIGDVWLVTGGVPCQPASVAGKRLGTADDRWLWPEALATVERIRSAWVLFENPTGILSLNDGVEFEQICLALESQGYEVQPIVIPACGIGALHRRNRVWILAYSKHVGRNAAAKRRSSTEGFSDHPQGAHEASEPAGICSSKHVADTFGFGGRAEIEGRETQERTASSWSGQDVSDSEPTRLEGDERGIIANQGEGRSDSNVTGSTWWSIEPNVGRLANGVSDRVGKLKCLGNAIVPQVAYQLIKGMIEAENRCDPESAPETWPR